MFHADWKTMVKSNLHNPDCQAGTSVDCFGCLPKFLPWEQASPSSTVQQKLILLSCTKMARQHVFAVEKRPKKLPLEKIWFRVREEWRTGVLWWESAGQATKNYSSLVSSQLGELHKSHMGGALSIPNQRIVKTILRWLQVREELCSFALISPTAVQVGYNMAAVKTGSPNKSSST